MTTFFPGVLSMPTSGRIIKIDNSEMPKPTAVFVIASINECFLDCIFSFDLDFDLDFNFDFINAHSQNYLPNTVGSSR